MGVWTFIAAVVVGDIWYGIRKREAEHETQRHVMRSGQSIDQAPADNLFSLSRCDNRRLDRFLKVGGLIMYFVVPGLALLGWFISLGPSLVG
jgi:hypothetical protein